MKKMRKLNRGILYLCVALLATSCFTGNGNVNPVSSPAMIARISAAENLFLKTEKEKDADNHRPLFLSAYAQVNFMAKSYGNPALLPLTRDSWIGFFTSLTYDFHPVYSDHTYFVEHGMAIDRHLFQVYKNGIKDVYGSDLFFYVDTPTGLKLVNITSTLVNPDDSTDYKSLTLMGSKPVTVLEAYIQGFNSKDTSVYQSTFANQHAACFSFNNLFSAVYSDTLQSASAWYARSLALTLKLKQLKVTTYDQLTAVANAGYILEEKGKQVEKGYMLATLAGTPKGWKIASMVFSADK